MKPCTTCGNDIADAATRCPFCEQPQPPAQARRRRRAAPVSQPPGRATRQPPRVRGAQADRAVPIIDLKQDMPLVADAVQRLDLALQSCRARGTPVVRVVHGWGSTGRGGAIGRAVRRALRSMQGRGAIRSFLAGEDYSEFDGAALALLERYPALAATLQSDRLNRGITIVEP